MKYRKKPVVIEAMQFEEQKGHHFGIRGTLESADKIFEWAKPSVMLAEYNREVGHCSRLSIYTLEGTMSAYPGDYVIKGIKNEFYPCKPDIFEASYEKVEE
jgi:hypothetical protein